jgi:hypothetical protein
MIQQSDEFWRKLAFYAQTYIFRPFIHFFLNNMPTVTVTLSHSLQPNLSATCRSLQGLREMHTGLGRRLISDERRKGPSARGLSR